MAEYTRDDELELSDIVAAARLAGMLPGTGRFSRAILGAGYRRTEVPSPDWDLRDDFASQAPDSAPRSYDALHDAVCTGPGVPAGFTCSHPSHTGEAPS